MRAWAWRGLAGRGWCRRSCRRRRWLRPIRRWRWPRRGDPPLPLSRPGHPDHPPGRPPGSPRRQSTGSSRSTCASGVRSSSPRSSADVIPKAALIRAVAASSGISRPSLQGLHPLVVIEQPLAAGVQEAADDRDHRDQDDPADDEVDQIRYMRFHVEQTPAPSTARSLPGRARLEGREVGSVGIRRDVSHIGPNRAAWRGAASFTADPGSDGRSTRQSPSAGESSRGIGSEVGQPATGMARLDPREPA